MGPGAASGRVRVGLLGVPEFSVDGVLIEFPRGRVLAVGVVLALAAGRPVAVETIAERVWGEELPADPRAAVHTAVARIRRLLGQAAVARLGAGYQLAARPDDVDVLRFERLLDAAGDRDAAEALRLLGEATALWRGEPFGPYVSDRLAPHEGQRLVDRYLTAVERRTDLELAANAIPAGRPSELRELCAHHQLRESLWLRLLRVLDAVGRRADALNGYEELKRRIADELGVGPATELRQFHAGLLAGTSPTNVDAASEAPRQLPADGGCLVGRDLDLRRLDEGVRSAPNSGGVVVVHGTGGVGKTTLVVHWAHRVRDQFPDGQLFVDLRGFGPGEPVAPSAALAALLHGLGVPADRLPDGTDARTAMFRSKLADRRMLIVLDNARSAEQVRPLLAGSGVLTLVTSRNQLRGLAARERAYRIALEVLEPADATSLMTERLAGQQVEHDEDSVERLAEICGRLPLALSIAAERAGRSPGRPLRDLVQQLENDRERLTLLNTGGDLSTDLRAVMSWSYRALEPDAVTLLRLLGLTPGGDFTVPSAAALAGIQRSAAGPLLDQLTDAHLVDQASAAGRFTMHDLTRAYAAERAEQDCSVTARRSALERICSWYTWSAANAYKATRNEPWPQLYGAPRDGVEPLDFHDTRQALAWFAQEDRTLYLTVGLANELGLYDDVIMLGRSLWNYWRYRSSFDDAPSLGRSILAAALAAGHKHAEASALHHLSAMHFYRREYGRTLFYADRSLSEYRVVGDVSGACLALGSVGLALLMLDRLDEAIATLERAVQVATACDDRFALATALNNLANAYKDSGRSSDAVRTATAALELTRDAKRRIEEAFTLDTLALALLSHGDPAAAAARQEEALAIHRELGNKWYQAVTLRRIARLLSMVGEYSRVRARCAEGLRILDDLGAEDDEQLSRADFEELLAALPT